MTNDELFSLIDRYRKGDDYAFTLFFNDTKNKVFANIYSFVKNEDIAEDVLSDTYVTFLKKIKTIKKDESILGLLYVIGKNLSLNYLKRNRQNYSLDDFPHITQKQDHPADKLDYEDLIILMKNVLSDDMFKVIIMRLINELEYKEISTLLKKKESTIRWLYAEGIKKVKEEIYARQNRK